MCLTIGKKNLAATEVANVRTETETEADKVVEQGTGVPFDSIAKGHFFLSVKCYFPLIFLVLPLRRWMPEGSIGCLEIPRLVVSPRRVEKDSFRLMFFSSFLLFVPSSVAICFL